MQFIDDIEKSITIPESGGTLLYRADSAWGIECGMWDVRCGDLRMWGCENLKMKYYKQISINS